MKILLIDDSNLARRILKRILEKENHEIIEVGSGMEGLEKFYLEKPGVVFLDLTMEGINGLEVLEKIKEIDPSAKVVIVSADIQKQTKELAIQKGALAFINKPVVEEEVLNIIKEISGG